MYKIRKKEHFSSRPEWVQKLLMAIDPDVYVPCNTLSQATEKLSAIRKCLEEKKLRNDKREARLVLSSREIKIVGVSGNIAFVSFIIYEY